MSFVQPSSQEKRPTKEFAGENLPIDPDQQWQGFLEIADPNEEDRSIQRAYQEARTLIVSGGSLEQAEESLKQALKSFPDSRHLNTLLAEIHWIRYKDEQGAIASLEKAVLYAKRGFESGLQFSRLDYRLSEILWEGFGALGSKRDLDELYAQAIETSPSDFLATLHYARGLAYLGDPRAEEQFKASLIQAAQQDASATVSEPYSEWLLDQKRYNDVLVLLAESEGPYLSFLRGVALESLGRLEEAEGEYAKYAELSEIYPAPSRMKIVGSPSQQNSGIHFQAESTLEASMLKTTKSQALKGLSFLIYGEAGGESVGGMRAEGWVVRNRVLRGRVYPQGSTGSCPNTDNSGSTLPDQYESVMCQGEGAQFNAVCLAWCRKPSTGSCTQTSKTTEAAKDVYDGYAPDPVGKHCPGGFQNDADWCSSSVRCKGTTDTYRIRGGLFNYSTPSGEPCPPRCAPRSEGKICGNGGSDNCFYATPSYIRGSVAPIAGSVSRSSCWVNSESGISSSSGTHSAHLEGPEDSSNPDFRLEFQKFGGSSWTTLRTSDRSGTVEDVEFNASAGKYRWRVCAVRGSGAFALYIKRP